MGFSFSVLDPEVVLCGMDLKLQIVLVEAALVIHLSLVLYVHNKTVNKWDKNVGSSEKWC